MNNRVIARKRIIKAFDDDLANNHEIAINILTRNISPFLEYTGMIKLGMKTITQIGASVIKVVHNQGFDVFYDLKIFDKPTLIKDAVYEATVLGAKIINIHPFGSIKIMQFAKDGMKKAVEENNLLRKPLLIAETVLTSISQIELNNEIGIPGTIAQTVERFAINAYLSGMDGVVCSGQEIEIVRKCRKIPLNFQIITPGIKMLLTKKDEQKRLTTPAQAIKAGADYLLIGKPIKTVDGAKKILNEVEMAIL